MKTVKTIAAIAAVVSLSNCGSYSAPSDRPFSSSRPGSAGYSQTGGSQQSSFLTGLRNFQEGLRAGRDIVREARATVRDGRALAKEGDRLFDGLGQ